MMRIDLGEAEDKKKELVQRIQCRYGDSALTPGRLARFIENSLLDGLIYIGGLHKGQYYVQFNESYLEYVFLYEILPGEDQLKKMRFIDKTMRILIRASQFPKLKNQKTIDFYTHKMKQFDEIEKAEEEKGCIHIDLYKGDS